MNEKPLKISDLDAVYDQMQRLYGAPELRSIYNGGCESQPDVCFVFMNPTGKNLAASPQWQGRRSPWIGTKNVWKLFYTIGLLSEQIYAQVLEKRPHQWDEAFAASVYGDITAHGVFITNLAKCTQPDARPIPNGVYREYLQLFLQEMELLQPKKIITFGNQVSSVVLGENISVSKCRKKCFIRTIAGREYPIYPVYYPIGNGMMNLDKAVEDLKFILWGEPNALPV